MSKELTLNLLRDRNCNNCGNYIWLMSVSTHNLHRKNESGICGITSTAIENVDSVCEKWVKK